MKEGRRAFHRADGLAGGAVSAPHAASEKGFSELAVHFFSALQGMAAVALGANEPEVVVMEARRLKDWIRTL